MKKLLSILVILNLSCSREIESSSNSGQTPAVSTTSNQISVANSFTITVGESKEINAKLVPSDLISGFAYQTSNASIFKVVGNKIEGVGIGTANLIIHQNDYNLSKTVPVNVVAAGTNVTELTIGVNSTDFGVKVFGMRIGQSDQLYARTSPISTLPVIWSSSNSNVVTIQNGLITARSNGEAIITASISNGVSNSLKVVVGAPSTVNTNGLIHYWGFDGSRVRDVIASTGDLIEMKNSTVVSSGNLGSLVANRKNIPLSSLQITDEFTYKSNQPIEKPIFTLSFWFKASRKGDVLGFRDGTSVYSQDYFMTRRISILQGPNYATNDVMFSTARYDPSICATCGDVMGRDFIRAYAAWDGTTYINPFDNQWHNISVTQDYNNIAIYYDGKFIKQSSIQGKELLRPNQYFQLGVAAATQMQEFNGIVDDIAMWNRVLPQNEILSNYTNNR